MELLARGAPQRRRQPTLMLGQFAAGSVSDRKLISLCDLDVSVIWWWSHDDVRNWRNRLFLLYRDRPFVRHGTPREH